MMERSQFVTAMTVCGHDAVPSPPQMHSPPAEAARQTSPLGIDPRELFKAFICCCPCIYAIWSLSPWFFLLVNLITFALPSPLLMFSLLTLSHPGEDLVSEPEDEAEKVPEAWPVD